MIGQLQNIKPEAARLEPLAGRAVDAELMGKFIAYLDAAPKTVETYTRAIRQFSNWLSVSGISRPGRADIIAYKDDLKAAGKKPTTIQNYLAAVKIFFRWTAQEGLYPNVADRVKGAKLDKDHKKDYLTENQVFMLLEQVEHDTEQGARDLAMLLLMVTGGLRTIEVARANVEDLRALGGGTVLYIQGKGREEKADYVKVNANTEKAVRAYLKKRGRTQGGEPLFASTSNNNRGERLTTRSISGIVKKHLLEAGYDSSRLTAHSLRHTAVTLALLEGKNLAEVQQFARHAKLDTTQIYNHALEKSRNSCGDAIERAISAFVFV